MRMWCSASHAVSSPEVSPPPRDMPTPTPAPTAMITNATGSTMRADLMQLGCRDHQPPGFGGGPLLPPPAFNGTAGNGALCEEEMVDEPRPASLAARGPGGRLIVAVANEFWVLLASDVPLTVNPFTLPCAPLALMWAALWVPRPARLCVLVLAACGTGVETARRDVLSCWVVDTLPLLSPLARFHSSMASFN
jgi:hypothetical protein